MRDILAEIAREAGKVLLKHFRNLSPSEIEQKDDNVKNLVTVADRESERIILDSLRQAFPGSGLIGEESGKILDGMGAMFIVDPLDGTTNYSHGVAEFAISIARCEGKTVTHGLIYLPYFNDLYYAERGKGATLNGQPIHVSPQENLPECLVATGFACVRAGYKPDGVPIFSKLIYKVRDLRRLGAATVDLAFVAQGIFEGFYEIGLAPWDVCAGALLVEEAGGRVSGFSGVEDPLFGDKILATNGNIHDRLKALIEGILAQER